MLVEDLTKRLESFNIRKPPPRPRNKAAEAHREEEDELILKVNLMNKSSNFCSTAALQG